MSEIGLITAFLAGLFSFLSPCILPLVPGYLSFMSGVSLEEMVAGRGGTTAKVVGRGLLFVFGFSIIFVALGAAATAVGAFLGRHGYFLNKVAGLVIILFGLQMLGVFRFRFLLAERRYQGRVMGGRAGAVILGMVFAFGWSPCYGPILSVILAYAGTQETVWKGVWLLAVYSAGLGLPFILISLGMGTFIRLLDRFRKYLPWIQAAAGVLMVVGGLLILTGWIQGIARIIPPGWSAYD